MSSCSLSISETSTQSQTSITEKHLCINIIFFLLGFGFKVRLKMSPRKQPRRFQIISIWFDSICFAFGRTFERHPSKQSPVVGIKTLLFTSKQTINVSMKFWGRPCCDLAAWSAVFVFFTCMYHVYTCLISVFFCCFFLSVCVYSRFHVHECVL